MTSDPPLHVALGPDLRGLPVRLLHGCFNWHYACCIRQRHKSVRAPQIFVSNSLATKVAQNALCPSTRGIPYMGLNTAESDSSATELSNGTWHNSLGDL